MNSNAILRKIYKLGQKKIVNESVLKDRDLVKPVIDSIRDIKGLKLLGYKRTNTNPQEMFQTIMMDHLAKSSGEIDKRNNTRRYVPTIDMNETYVDQIDIWFVLPISFVKAEVEDIERYIKNTYKRAEMMSGMGNFEEFIPGALPELPCDTGTLKSWVLEDDQDLIISTNLYIPRLMNGMAYVLNGNRYYNGYYRHERTITKSGALRVEHATHDSYMSVDDNGHLQIKIYNIPYNPFEIIMANGNMSMHYAFSEFYVDDKSNKYSDVRKTIESTLAKWKSDGRVITEDVDVTSTEVINGILQLFSEDQERYMFSLHKSLIKSTRREIMSKFPKKRGSLEDVICRFNIRPHMVVASIKENKQYTISEAVNEIDLDESFKYVRMLGGTKNISADKRTFVDDELGICSPEGTSQSKSVGLNGMMVYGIDSKFLKHD